jgi:hypothetical protein
MSCCVTRIGHKSLPLVPNQASPVRIVPSCLLRSICPSFGRPDWNLVFFASPIRASCTIHLTLLDLTDCHYMNVYVALSRWQFVPGFSLLKPLGLMEGEGAYSQCPLCSLGWDKILSNCVLKWSRNGAVGVSLVTGLQVGRSRDRGSVSGGARGCSVFLESRLWDLPSKTCSAYRG